MARDRLPEEWCPVQWQRYDARRDRLLTVFEFQALDGSRPYGFRVETRSGDRVITASGRHGFATPDEAMAAADDADIPM